MNKKYIELFKELAHNTEVAAEEVMEYDRAKNDEASLATAQTMRDDFSKLYDKLRDENFDGALTKNEYAQLLAGCYVIIGNLQDRIEVLKAALTGYQSEVIPNLDKILAAETDEEAQKLADELFVIVEN